MSWGGEIPVHPVEAAACVYVEVPKAGCTSIKWALSPFRGGRPPEGTDIHRWFGYTHARDVAELRGWLDTRWAEMFRFTVVRDPVARFESFYYGLAPHERGCYGDIDRYLVSGAFEGDERWRSNIHAIPQTQLIGDDLQILDFVGRTEQMEVVEAELIASVDKDIRIEHHNASSATRRDLSDAAITRLHEIYRADFEVLGYA